MWKALEQDSRRPKRNTTNNFLERVSAFKNEVEKPLNILLKDWKDKIKTSGIKDFNQDIVHVENQMKEDQIGGLGPLDQKQLKRDRRHDQEIARKEAKAKKIAAEKDAVPQEVISDEEEIIDNNNDQDFACPKSLRPKRIKINVMQHVSEPGLARGISVRDQTVMAAATAKALGWDLKNTNISVSSTSYHNKKTLKVEMEQLTVMKLVIG